MVEYGEPPARKHRRVVSALAQSCYPDDALSSADHIKKSKELYTMELRFQPLNLQLTYRPVKVAFVKVARRRVKGHPKIIWKMSCVKSLSPIITFAKKHALDGCEWF